jgi:hypothetical protein
MGRTPRPQQQRRKCHHPEGAGVDEHRHIDAAEAGEDAADRRPGGHAHVASGLDEAVDLRLALVARDRRHQRELGRLRDREADAEQRGEHQDRGDRVERQRQRRGDRHLAERGDEQHAARLQPVDQQPGHRRKHDHRCPQRDEQGRYRDARVGHLL